MPVSTPQLAHLNQQPLNREAQRWLLHADAHPDESSQYLLQLMWWGLTEGNLYWGTEQSRRLKERLTNLVLNLFEQENQERVLRLMRVGASPDDQDENLSLATLQNAQNPKDAAWRALDALNSATSALPSLDPTYPTE